MTVDELVQRATEASTAGSGYMNLILPAKRPPGFPRGELMCVNGDQKVYSVSAFKILKWAKEYGRGTTGISGEK